MDERVVLDFSTETTNRTVIGTQEETYSAGLAHEIMEAIKVHTAEAVDPEQLKTQTLENPNPNT